VKFLRHLLGITKLDKEKNQSIREKTGAQDIVEEIKQYQKKWLQHVQRMDTNTRWRMKCHTIDCANNTFLLLQKHLKSGTEFIPIGWKIVPNEEHVQCDHRFASQPLANEHLHSSQLFHTSLQKARGTTSLCGP